MEGQCMLGETTSTSGYKQVETKTKNYLANTIYDDLVNLRIHNTESNVNLVQKELSTSIWYGGSSERVVSVRGYRPS